MAKEYFGNYCWNCGRSSYNRRMIKHEINGLKHDRSIYYYAIHPERYISLCCWCHGAFHRLMEVGYSFEEILNIFKWETVYP